MNINGFWLVSVQNRNQYPFFSLFANHDSGEALEAGVRQAAVDSGIQLHVNLGSGLEFLQQFSNRQFCRLSPELGTRSFSFSAGFFVGQNASPANYAYFYISRSSKVKKPVIKKQKKALFCQKSLILRVFQKQAEFLPVHPWH